ncbi:ABC1 kinase family protein [Sphingomonas canadensis]|uniref:ABC1 kinase family protein n=1 Tax=Sphingomonas canadensis TaxID=1219257 RepID=UPI00223151FC|nr:AarF/UbiB family protein [Sphingomonas canadensis]
MAASDLLTLFLLERVRRVPLERSAMPSRLRRTLERLGPTFVKAGQALSLRQDIVPQAYLVELEKLQADVAPFPAEEARREIARAFDASVEELFATFEDLPMAAASIAQVHAATMADGRRVIVKVRRPGIKRRIDRDMRSLMRVLRLCEALSSRLARLQPASLAKEIWNNLRRETDFRLEARAMRQFATAFKDDPAIEAPAPIDALIAERVLVQERKQGHLLGDPCSPTEARKLADLLIGAYLRQIFVLGFFHGDPHPGNLFFTHRGAICFHDFGLVARLDQGIRRDLAMFLQAFAHQDAVWMLDSAIALGLLAPGDRRGPFVAGIEEILADYAALPIGQWSIADILLRVSRLGAPGSVRIPYGLLVLMRAAFLLESALRRLDPEMKLAETLASRGQSTIAAMLRDGARGGLERLRSEIGVAAQMLPAAVASTVSRDRQAGLKIRVPIELPEVAKLRTAIEHTGNRLAMAIVILGLFVGSSLLMQHSIGPRLFGVPVLALAGYLLGIWFALRLARAIGRSGQL